MDSWCYVSKRVHRTNINLWQNLWWCWYHHLMMCHQLAQSEWGPDHIHFFIIYHYQECVCLGKQRIPWWDAAFCSVLSGSTLFVYVPFLYSLWLFCNIPEISNCRLKSMPFLYIFPVLTFAAETCMYTNGLRIRIAVYVYCEDGYFCCENNTQCWLVFLQIL